MTIKPWIACVPDEIAALREDCMAYARDVFNAKAERDALQSKLDALRDDDGDGEGGAMAIKTWQERMKPEYATVTILCTKFMQQEIDELRAALAESERDAARYRWLRSTTNFVTSHGERIDVREQPELWDESIDAAMKEKQNG